MSMAEQKRAWQNANGKDPDGPGPGGAAPEGKDAGEGDGEGFDVIPGFEPMDPFLMVGFHSDVFPARNSLDQTPGFPQHPHYGFETVTVMGRGNTVTDHADSMGGSGRYGDGDVQWMCAGRGISHSEMIGLRNADTQNVGEVFQLWLNLPAKSKKCEPHTTMMWAEDIPEVQGEGGATSCETHRWTRRAAPSAELVGSGRAEQRPHSAHHAGAGGHVHAGAHGGHHRPQSLPIPIRRVCAAASGRCRRG